MIILRGSRRHIWMKPPRKIPAWRKYGPRCQCRLWSCLYCYNDSASSVMKPVTLSLLQPSQHSSKRSAGRKTRVNWANMKWFTALYFFYVPCEGTMGNKWWGGWPNKGAIHFLIGEKDRVMIGMRVYIISIEVGCSVGGSGSGRFWASLSLQSHCYSPLPPLLPSVQWVNNGGTVAAGALEQWHRARGKNFKGFISSLQLQRFQLEWQPATVKVQ